MNAAFRHLRVLLVGAGILIAVVTSAQTVTNPHPSVPPIPVVKSPVDAFRELLAMDAGALRAALSNRNDQARERLRKKINEYKAMDADERELRLLTTELRWYVSRLMQVPATNRTAQLPDIRSDLRPLVESRLARWDQVDEELRHKYIRNEEAMSLLLKYSKASAGLQQLLVTEVPPEMRATLQQALGRLDAMSPAERDRAFDVFENMFTVTAAEKLSALQVMSEVEQQQMQKTLEAFSQLSVERRKTCIRSYEKFVGMTPTERALFLRNVQKWEKMSPKERQEWRELVKNVEILPPMPEAKPQPPPLPPPMPPRALTNRT